MTPNGHLTEFTRSGAHSAKNARQTGAPNHLKGSGETAMVGTHTITDHTPDRVTVETVRTRLNGQSYRFITAGKRGLSVHIDALAELVTEIVTELTDYVVAERDALAEDLAWELNATCTEHAASATDVKEVA